MIYLKQKKTQEVIESMVDGLNDHRIEDIGEFFSRNQVDGNFGCGTKIWIGRISR